MRYRCVLGLRHAPDVAAPARGTGGASQAARRAGAARCGRPRSGAVGGGMHRGRAGAQAACGGVRAGSARRRAKQARQGCQAQPRGRAAEIRAARAWAGSARAGAPWPFECAVDRPVRNVRPRATSEVVRDALIRPASVARRCVARGGESRDALARSRSPWPEPAIGGRRSAGKARVVTECCVARRAQQGRAAPSSMISA